MGQPVFPSTEPAARQTRPGPRLGAPKVLPDWNSSGIRTAASTEQAEALCLEVGDSIEAFFAKEKRTRTIGKQPPLAKHDQLACNREMAIALDHALQSSLLDLRRFLPERRCSALTPRQRRYFVDVPPERLVAGSSSRRACVWDEDAQKGEVEVPRSFLNGKPHAPALHKTVDEGAVGFIMTHWLDCSVGARGSSFEDKWHRFFNDMKSALIENKIWVIVLERMVVFNVMTAPYASHGFYCQAKSAAEEYFSSRSPDCLIFRSLYEDRFVNQIGREVAHEPLDSGVAPRGGLLSDRANAQGPQVNLRFCLIV